MLDLEQVDKSFYDPGRGEVRAVDRLTCHLADGVVALVGANGAGKSTLLRLISTLLRPDRGRISFNGFDTTTHAGEVRRQLGYLSTTTRLYPRFTSLELLRYSGGFFPLTPADLDQRVAVMINTFGLEEFLHQRISGLSTGQLQRLNLARTLLPDPNLLILDEPTTGLDLIAAHQVVQAVRGAKRPGRLIILATHIMQEVELVADRVLIMRHGRVVDDEAPAGLGAGAALEASVYRLLTTGEAATA
jgi:sodium transport system ATP-binding protein